MQKEYKLYSCLSYKSKLDKNKKDNSSWKVYISVMQDMYERICFKLCKKCGLIGHTKDFSVKLKELGLKWVEFPNGEQGLTNACNYRRGTYKLQ